MSFKQTLSHIARYLKKEFEYYQHLHAHQDTPRLAKALLYLAIAYILLPFDLIPDFLPIIGQLDEVIIVPLLIYFALKLIPDHIKLASKKQVSNMSNTLN